jgi:hypothetical protein
MMKVPSIPYNAEKYIYTYIHIYMYLNIVCGPLGILRNTSGTASSKLF